VDIYIGDTWAHWFVQVYQPAFTLEGIRPGQHLAVPVRLTGGEMRSWQIPATPRNYFVAMLPDRDTLQVPRLAIVGANCDRGLIPHSYDCVALHGASVIAYHPREDHPGEEWRGTIAVWRNPCLRSGPIRLRTC